MAGNEEFMRFMAAWALVHETADEGWKAAVERGSGQATGEMESGPEAFVDGLSAMIAEEKERLKAELASGKVAAPGDEAGLSRCSRSSASRSRSSGAGWSRCRPRSTRALPPSAVRARGVSSRPPHSVVAGASGRGRLAAR